MISRQWRGLCKPEHAEAYVEHLHAETLAAIASVLAGAPAVAGAEDLTIRLSEPTFVVTVPGVLE